MREWLLTRDTRSASSLYERLVDDIRNDIVRLGPFLEIARKVVDLDVKRDKSMAYVSVLSPEEIIDAKNRIAENRLVIGWVYRALVDRAASYRFAMERLVIHVPSDRAVEVERQWTLLEDADRPGVDRSAGADRGGHYFDNVAMPIAASRISRR